MLGRNHSDSHKTAHMTPWLWFWERHTQENQMNEEYSDVTSLIPLEKNILYIEGFVLVFFTMQSRNVLTQTT